MIELDKEKLPVVSEAIEEVEKVYDTAHRSITEQYTAREKTFASLVGKIYILETYNSVIEKALISEIGQDAYRKLLAESTADIEAGLGYVFGELEDCFRKNMKPFAKSKPKPARS